MAKVRVPPQTLVSRELYLGEVGVQDPARFVEDDEARVRRLHELLVFILALSKFGQLGP